MVQFSEKIGGRILVFSWAPDNNWPSLHWDNSTDLSTHPNCPFVHFGDTNNLLFYSNFIHLLLGICSNKLHELVGCFSWPESLISLALIRWKNWCIASIKINNKKRDNKQEESKSIFRTSTEQFSLISHRQVCHCSNKFDQNKAKKTVPKIPR